MSEIQTGDIVIQVRPDGIGDGPFYVYRPEDYDGDAYKVSVCKIDTRQAGRLGIQRTELIVTGHYEVPNIAANKFRVSPAPYRAMQPQIRAAAAELLRQCPQARPMVAAE